jgi:CheY-like chemotaxis protein
MAETVVFVVANDRTFRRAISSALWQTGLHAISMRGGPPAVEWARAARPALIVIDHGRPGLDGLALARRLKRQRGTETIPILLMSDAGPDGRDQARAAGCDGFISKPFTIADLAVVVRQCTTLGQRAPTGSAA